MTEPTIFTTVWCGYCRRLKSQLDRIGVTYREIDIERDPEAAELVSKANGGNHTVPTVLLPNGTTLTNPSVDEVVKALPRAS